MQGGDCDLRMEKAEDELGSEALGVSGKLARYGRV